MFDPLEHTTDTSVSADYQQPHSSDRAPQANGIVNELIDLVVNTQAQVRTSYEQTISLYPVLINFLMSSFQEKFKILETFKQTYPGISVSEISQSLGQEVKKDLVKTQFAFLSLLAELAQHDSQSDIDIFHARGKILIKYTADQPSDPKIHKRRAQQLTRL